MLTTQIFISGPDFSLTLDLYNCLLDASTWMYSRHLTLAMTVFALLTIPHAPKWPFLSFQLLRLNLEVLLAPLLLSQPTIKACWLHLQIPIESDHCSLLPLYPAAEPAPSFWITVIASKPAALLPPCPTIACP